MTKEYLMKEIRKEFDYYKSRRLTRPEYIGSIVGRIEGYATVLWDLDLITDNGYDLFNELTSRMLQSI